MKLRSIKDKLHQLHHYIIAWLNKEKHVLKKLYIVVYTKQ